ncbi:MAG: alkaline phosphatase PhoX, partial [Synechocystis sp.]|nr:alkaline phosphatase PhoX [Synechocystis sp.]
DKANSRLFANGKLYGAKFNPDGTGDWIPLAPDTPINPILPSQIANVSPETAVVFLPNPDRQQAGASALFDDQAVAAYQAQFKTLGDLYPVKEALKQGAILVDAHLAANAIGVTPTARPEDTEILPDGSVVVAFTAGGPSKSDGGCDRRIFQGPNGETPYELGWIMRLQEDGDRCYALTFRWQMIATGGEPAAGGMGFANPDNLAIDGRGDLWMVTDMSTTRHNQPFNRRADAPSHQALGAFGNNSLWYLPLRGSLAGQAFPFALGPMDSELTGPVFSQDQKTLFLAVQHPGEVNGLRQQTTVDMPLTTTNGDPFNQTRTIPLLSHWPSGGENPPRPAVVTIQLP